MNFKLLLAFLIFSLTFTGSNCLARNPTCDEFNQFLYLSKQFHLKKPTIDEELIIKSGKLYIEDLDGFNMLLTKNEYNKLIKDLEYNSDIYLNLLFDKKCDLFKSNIEAAIKKGEDRRFSIIKEAFELGPKKRKVKPIEGRTSLKNIREFIISDIQNYLFANKKSLDATKKYILNKKSVLFSKDKDAKNAVLLKAFYNALDPHTTYFSPVEWSMFEESTSGNIVGLGVGVKSDPVGVKVETVIKGAALDKLHVLESGDYITKVNGKLIKKESDFSEIILNEPEGTEFEIEAVNKDSKIIKFKISNEKYSNGHVTSELKIINGKNILLSTIPTFYYDESLLKGAAEDFYEQFIKIKEKNHIDSIVIDLRGNPGGFLDQALKLIGVFVGNKIGIYSKGSDGLVIPTMAEAKESLIPENIPLTILTNKYSASSSEIFSGALSNYGRALIVGDDRTYGKGSVQRVFTHAKSENLGVITFTIAQFYLPNGESTQIKGVPSDIIIPGPYTDKDIGEGQCEYPLAFDTVKSRIKTKHVEIDIQKLAEISRNRVSKIDKFKKRYFDAEDIVLNEALNISTDYLSLKENSK